MDLTGCTITDSTALGKGAGMYISTNSKVTLSDCTITGNTANSFGGGLYVTQSNLYFNGCEVDYNVATSGGVRAEADSFVSLTDTTFANNLARGAAGINGRAGENYYGSNGSDGSNGGGASGGGILAVQSKVGADPQHGPKQHGPGRQRRRRRQRRRQPQPRYRR